MTVIPEPGLRAELGSAARPLLEREGELGALHAAIEAARKGDGQLVVVEGAAGIGKTRLLHEARLMAPDFEVLTARAGEFEGEFAFGIVRQLFEPALAVASNEVRAELLSGAAELSARLFAVPGAPVDGAGGEASFAVLHGLYWLAANFALRMPTLLVVDDLHWADEPSLRWLGYLARRLEGLPLLLLLGTRPPEQAGRPTPVTEILADPLAAMIRPAALGQASTATLAEVRYGLQPDDAFAAELLAVSGGNPLYLAAVLDTVAREGIEPIAVNAARLRELGGDAVSRGVSLRVSRLTDDAIAFVRAAAILGDGADLTHAAVLARLEVEAAGRAASALVAADLLRHENPLEFIHPVVRTAIYQGMSEGDRLSGHRRAAEALLEAGLPPEQAGAHLQSTLPARDPFVVATLRAAARRSLAQGAPEAAAAYLRRALDEPPSSDEHGEVLGELGIVETQTLMTPQGAEHLRESLAGLEDVTLRPDLVLAYAQALSHTAARPREGVALMQQLSDQSISDRDLRERVEAQLAMLAWFDPELYPIARERCSAALESDSTRPIQSSLLLEVLAMEVVRRGLERQHAMELAQRALKGSVSENQERMYVVNALQALSLAGDPEAAAGAAEDVLALARRAGDQFSAGTIHLWLGVLRAEQGRLLEAEEHMNAPDVVSATGWDTHLAYRAGFLIPVLLDRGAGGEAQALADQVGLDGIQPGHQITFVYGRGRLKLDTARPDQSVTDFQTAGGNAQSLGIENPAFCPWRSQAALALHRLGQVEEALELAREELKLSRRWGAPRTVGVSLRALGLVEGGSIGEGLLREAVDVLAGSPARLEHARALIDLGGALRRANSRSEARKHLREGVDLAREAGATALVTRGNEELAATGAHPRSVMLSGLESLTASERRVAQMAAEEASNKEIAQALFVTVKTVEVHLSRVYRKLDIESRRQLAGALASPARNAGASSR